MIDNGGRGDRSADDIPVGYVVKYTCDSGYFPTGPNADQLETQCMSGRVYSHQAAQLATCSLIGSFFNFLLYR